MFVNPGTQNLARPAQPALGAASVELLDGEGNVLATGTSFAAGVPVALLGVVTPGDGFYRIRVKSADSQPATTGNYFLSLYSAAIETRAILSNQIARGVLQNSYSVDRWVMSAATNQQLQLDLLAAASADIRFRLTGPNGWIGFENLDGDSTLLTLPTTGQYVLEAYSAGMGSGGYAFTLVETGQTSLPLGTPYVGMSPGNYSSQLFRVTVADGNPLDIDFVAAGTDNYEIYVGQSAPPTRQHYDYRSAEAGANHNILIQFAAPGTWYVLVYAESTSPSSEFTLEVRSSAVLLSKITPAIYGANQDVAVTLSGAGFLPGTMAELVSGTAVRTAEDVQINSIGQMTATFSLASLAEGVFDVRVVRADGESDTLAGVFTVAGSGEGKLETDIILPGVLGRHATATLYVEYANTGAAAIPSPILTLQSGMRTIAIVRC